MKEKLAACKTCGREIAKSAKTCPSCGAKAKRGHPVLGGVLIFLGACAIIGALSNELPEDTSSDVNKPTITLEEFEAVKTGMSYDEVVAIIGGDGIASSEVDLGVGNEYKTAMYIWDGEGSLGANANITFQGGKVVSKAQIGLD